MSAHITVWTYEDAFTMALDDERDEYDRTRGGEADHAECESCGAIVAIDDITFIEGIPACPECTPFP